jgi:transposase InsO family protein
MMQLEGHISVEEICQAVQVSRAGYYRHLDEQAPEEAAISLRDAIQKIALQYRCYGYRRVTAELRQQGLVVNGKRVLRVMREDNLLSLRKRKFIVTTNSRHGWWAYPNLAAGLHLTGVNQLWVADITYIRLQDEFIFLAVLLDAFSRRIVGWELGESLQASLPLRALDRAIANRSVPIGVVHHSDQGVQYACGDYVEQLLTQGFRISMSRKAAPWENAKAESFIKTLKAEEVWLKHYRDVNDARASIGHFLDDVYNQRRLHSALGYRSPATFEADQDNRTSSGVDGQAG